MKCTIPEISWHNRDPVLSVDVQPITSEGFYRLASGGTDSHVLIWHLKILETGATTTEPVSDLTRHQRAVNVVRWSPSGQYLASGDDDANIIIWHQKSDDFAIMLDGDNDDKEKWNVLKVLRGHKEDVYDICWSPDSVKLISGSVDNTAIIWDLNRGLNDNILTDQKGFVQGVTWDPLGQFVATLSSDRICRVFSETGKQVKARVKKGLLPVQESHFLHGQIVRYFHDDTLKSYFRRLTFSPDGSLLITPAGCLETGPNNKKLYTSYIYTTGSLTQPAAILPSPGQYTVAARCCPLLFQLRADGPEPFISLPYRIVFAIATRSSVMLYDTQQLSPFATISNIHYTRLTDVTWSQDGRLLAVSSTDGFCSLVTFEPEELGVEFVKETEVMEMDQNDTLNETAEDIGDLNVSVDEKKEKKPSFLEKWTKKIHINEKKKVGGTVNTVSKIEVRRKPKVIAEKSNENVVKEEKPISKIEVRRKEKEVKQEKSNVETEIKVEQPVSIIEVKRKAKESEVKPETSTEKEEKPITRIEIKRKSNKPEVKSEKSNTKSEVKEEKPISRIAVKRKSKGPETKLKTSNTENEVEEEKPTSKIEAKSEKSNTEKEVKEEKPISRIAVKRKSKGPETKLKTSNTKNEVEEEKLISKIEAKSEKSNTEKEVKEENSISRIAVKRKSEKSSEKEDSEEKPIFKIAVRRKPRVTSENQEKITDVEIEDKSVSTKEMRRKSIENTEKTDSTLKTASKLLEKCNENVTKADETSETKVDKEKSIEIDDDIQIIEPENNKNKQNVLLPSSGKNTPNSKNLQTPDSSKKKRGPKSKIASLGSTPTKPIAVRKKPGGQLNITQFLKSPVPKVTTPTKAKEEKSKFNPIILLQDYNKTGKIYEEKKDKSGDKSEKEVKEYENNDVITIDDDSCHVLPVVLNCCEDDTQNMKLVLEETMDEPIDKMGNEKMDVDEDNSSNLSHKTQENHSEDDVKSSPKKAKLVNGESLDENFTNSTENHKENEINKEENEINKERSEMNKEQNKNEEIKSLSKEKNVTNSDTENCDTKESISVEKLEIKETDKPTLLSNVLSLPIGSPAKKRVPLITLSSPKHKKGHF